MKRKILGIFSTILILLGIMPISVFAETTVQEGAVIQDAVLKHNDGTEITAENPVKIDESIEVEMQWLIPDGETFPVDLPNNLVFKDQEGNIEGSKRNYTVRNNQLAFSSEGIEENQRTIASVTLKAVTNGKNSMQETVDFGNAITKTLYYTTAINENSESITPRNMTPRVSKEITPNIKNVLLEKSDGSGGWLPIKEGDLQLTTKGFRLSVDWEIPDSSTIQSGDYMEIKLPSILRLTDVPTKNLEITVEGTSYHVGTYELKSMTDVAGKYDYSIFRVEFNDTISKEKITAIENGYFRYTGLFNKELSQEEIVTIGDFELPSFTIGKNPDREINFYDNLYKQGYQATNTNRLQWSVQVNMDDVTSIYKGGKASSETFSNAVFVDELDEGLSFLREQVGNDAVPFPYRAGVSIYKVLADGTVTDSRIASVLMHRNNYHDVAASIDMSSINAAKEDIKNHPVGSFAIYTDAITKKETLLIHLGEIADKTPGTQAGLVFDRTWEYMENMINSATSMTNEEKVATLAALKNLYDESNGTWSIGYTIEMQAQAASHIPSDHKFSNTAHLYYDNGDLTSNESVVTYQKSDAGGEGKVPKNTIEIVKKDKATDQAIANVQFEVVKYDGDKEGERVGTITTDTGGKATLGNLKVGKYKIKEISGLDNYDPKMIIENQTNLTTDGVFEISASDTEGFTFTIYNKRLSGTVDLKVKKILTGSTLQAGNFEFTLAGHGENQTKTNAENGDVKFDTINYDTPGTYTYTIEETKGNVEGITYDPKKITATVTVEKGQGELEASVAYTDNDGDDSNTPEEFINSYVKPKEKPTSIVLTAKKTLTGKQLSADEFDFKLTGHGEDQTKANAENGEVKFEAIDYDTVGTYIYEIEEIAGNMSGITYDTKKVTATVMVEENSKNELEANVVYTDNDGDDSNPPEEFINSYVKPKAKPTSIVLKAKKTLTGKPLSANDFDFKLTGHGEDQTKANAENGEVKFEAIDYDTAGTYIYEIEEVAGNMSGITYDTKKVTATVTVEENSKNELEASVTYTDNDGDDANPPEEFINKYTEQKKENGKITIVKIDGDTNNTLEGAEFELRDAENKVVTINGKQTAITGEKGKLTISDLAPGKYTLTEVKAPNGYELDATPIHFEIKSSGSSNLEKDQTEVKNHQKKEGVTLKKVDNKDSRKTLRNAEFELQNAKGEVVPGYEKLTTDENGLIYLENLPKGNYQFVETKAPEGYILDSAPVKFSLKENQRVDVVKENTMFTTGKEELPSTNTNKGDGNSSGGTYTTVMKKLLPNTGEQQRPFIWIGILCLLSAILIYYSRRKKGV